ncbi:MAG: hypothetical protein RIB43_16725 [Rhodospirillaceae bacterium]
MRIFIKAAYVSVLMFGLGACSEQTSLENFLTEDIVREYHARLDSITNNVELPISELLTPNKSVLDMSPKEAAPYKASLNELVSSLQPYADAGNRKAALIMAGVHLTMGNTPLFNGDRCKGLRLIYEGSQLGGMEGASSALLMANYFENASPFKDTTNAALFWTIEAYHRDPEFPWPPELLKDIVLKVPPETLVEWAMWSPKTDPRLKKEIERICRN